MKLLKIKNLWVKSKEREIIRGVDFEMKAGEVQVLLGPNASGKSTFAHSIAGDPRFEITKGYIFFAGKNITKLPPEDRVNLGIVLSWQTPPAFPGIKFSQIIENIKKKDNQIFKIDPSLFLREFNVNFSGGERKIAELMQVLYLKPRLVIFDEIDTGLDIKKLKEVSKIIKKELINKGVSVLLITHSGVILNFLRPSVTNVMIKGKIICKAKDYKRVLAIIEKYDYEKCKRCKLLSD
ncbi:ATP-binding cassette domain-containing protein [bacterium]|nr:ATP-binding cassette domain-containing protein [bacterium]